LELVQESYDGYGAVMVMMVLMIIIVVGRRIGVGGHSSLLMPLSPVAVVGAAFAFIFYALVIASVVVVGNTCRHGHPTILHLQSLPSTTHHSPASF
jgi:hypothetical protein